MKCYIDSLPSVPEEKEAANGEREVTFASVTVICVSQGNIPGTHFLCSEQIEFPFAKTCLFFIMKEYQSVGESGQVRVCHFPGGLMNRLTNCTVICIIPALLNKPALQQICTYSESPLPHIRVPGLLHAWYGNETIFAF